MSRMPTELTVTDLLRFKEYAKNKWNVEDLYFDVVDYGLIMFRVNADREVIMPCSVHWYEIRKILDEIL